MTDAMHLFPSEDWVDAFCTNFERHPEAPEAAEALAGTYRLVVAPAGPLTELHRYHVLIEPDGSAPTVTRLAGEIGDPRLALAADYERWRQLLEGRLDIRIAVLLGRLRISGDLAGIRSRLDETRPLLEALRAVNTRWRD